MLPISAQACCRNRYRRPYLGELCRLVVRILKAGFSAMQPRGRPAFILYVQTFGDLVTFNPHIHALVADVRFLVSCLAVVLLTVVPLKDLSSVRCAKDLLRYGGDLPDVEGRFTLARMLTSARSHGCWHSGHASGGFALVALGFLNVSPRNRVLLWLAAVTAGCVMGAYKVARGAHFVSHIVAIALIAQILICMIAGLTLPQISGRSKI